MNWEVFRAYDIRGIYPSDIEIINLQQVADGTFLLAANFREAAINGGKVDGWRIIVL